MELCGLNLETFIHSEHMPSYERDFYPLLKPGSQLPLLRFESMWPIMLDIVNGLHFIHRHEQVHRDLKPRNSKPWTENI